MALMSAGKLMEWLLNTTSNSTAAQTVYSRIGAGTMATIATIAETMVGPIAMNTSGQTFYDSTGLLQETVNVGGLVVRTTPAFDPHKVIERQRLVDAPYLWADFSKHADGNWYIDSRTERDGMFHDYTPMSHADRIINDYNSYFRRLIVGEGIVTIPHTDEIVRTEKKEEDEGNKTAKKERHVLYTNLAERIEKVEKLFGLTGEVKKSDGGDILMALLERIEEIEAYIESRT